MTVFKDDISIVLCGEAGLGINTVETLLVKILKISGYNVFSSKEYMSRIRGGSNSTWLRVSSNRVKAPVRRVDIFVPLDKDSIPHLEKYLSKDTLIIGDKSILATDKPVIDVPFAQLSSELGTRRLADEANMSEAYFCRLFKRLTGISPAAYVQARRVERAASLIGEGGMSVSEAAFTVGFNDSGYFSRVFKRLKGIAPVEYCRGNAGIDASRSRST